MIIKLAANNLPSYVTEIEISPGVTGYQITFPDNSTDTMSLGDFIIENSSTDITLVRRSLYDSNTAIKAQITETVGRDASRSLITAIRGLSGLTGAQQITLVEYMCTVFFFLSTGEIQASRDLAFGKATTAVYTQTRKDFAVAEIDKAVVIVS